MLGTTAVLAQNLGLAQGPRSVVEGVYTPEQAQRGAEAYGTYCKSCHEGVNQDGPNLIGFGFLDRWREDRLEGLFLQIKNNMPGNRPGGLPVETYVDILAFLLEANELPAGSNELKADMVGAIQLVGKDGPKPLPNLAPIMVVGCLTAGADNAWTLMQAGSPVRTRTLTTTTPEELKASASLPLGNQTFKLQNVTSGSNISENHKVQAKGVLITQGNSRINVTSLESLAPTCVS